MIKFLIRQGFRHNWSFIFIELKSFFTLFPALHNDIHWKRNWQFRSLIRSTLVIQSVFGIVGHCSDLFVSARSSLWRSEQDSSVLGSVVTTQARTKTRKKEQPRNSVITPTWTELSFFLLSVTIACAKLLGNAKLKMTVMPTGQSEYWTSRQNPIVAIILSSCF